MLKKIFEKIAPSSLAFENDAIGLQVGTWNQQVNKLLVTLDINEQVVDEAIEKGVQMIFSHHALLYRPLSKIIIDSPEGKIINKLITNNISVFSAHTNLDIVNEGVNDSLARALALEEIDILQITKTDKLKKLVVFVPVTHVNEVLKAIGDAGAGHIGDYSHCTFQNSGIGTFMPLSGSKPFIGDTNKLSKVEEIKIETIITDNIREQVIKSMINAHPYEEVAYDIYELDIESMRYGIGRIGVYNKPIDLSDLIKKVKDVLNIPVVQIAGNGKDMIQTVAVCGGSGGKFLSAAKNKQADVYITGESSYHDAQWAVENDIILINAGHYNTEHLIVETVSNSLQKLFEENGLAIEVYQSKVNTNPFYYL